MVPKLTLDGGLLREDVLLPAVRTLKHFETEGRVELFECDRAKETPAPQVYGWPGASGTPRPYPRFRTTKRPDSAGISFQQMSVVLFPMRDTHRLAMNEVNDVAHLLRHHALGHTIFVTTNAKRFIEEGKRERLGLAFKIRILTPDEAVLAVQRSDGFGQKEKKAQVP